MSLDIKKAHLKYAPTLMVKSLGYPQLFYENADIFYHFFKRLDEETTTRMKKIAKIDNIPKAYFGQMVIDMSNMDFTISKNVAPDKKEAIKKFSRNTFLNLAAWYICPLLEANMRRCPYITSDWIKNFLTVSHKRSPAERSAYYDSIRAFINIAQAKKWIRALDGVATQLGKDAENYILLLIGLFLTAHEEQQYQRSLPSTHAAEQETPKHIEIDLSPEIIEFLNSIKDIENLDDPPSS